MCDRYASPPPALIRSDPFLVPVGAPRKMVLGLNRWNNVPASPLNLNSNSNLPKRKAVPDYTVPVLHNYPPLPPLADCYPAWYLDIVLPKVDAFLAGLSAPGVLYLNFRLDHDMEDFSQLQSDLPVEFEIIEEFDFAQAFRSQAEPFYFRVARLFLNRV